MYAAEHLSAARVAESLRAQRSFLQDHLGRWAGALGRRMVLRARHRSFYAVAGCGLEDWIDEDIRLLGIASVEFVETPIANWPEPGSDELGSDEPAVIGLDEIEVR
jgi:hypothetical protein